MPVALFPAVGTDSDSDDMRKALLFFSFFQQFSKPNLNKQRGKCIRGQLNDTENSDD